MATTLRSATLDLIRQPRAWMLLVLLAWTAVSLPSLATYPAPYPDDAWIAAPAKTWLETGEFGLPLFTDIIGTERNYVHNGRIYSIALAGIFRVFGFGVVEGRALSFAGALIAAALVYALGRRLYGGWVGLFAAALFLFSWRMMYAGHVLRPDTWVAAGGLANLYLFLHLRDRRAAGFTALWPWVLAGLAVALIVDVYSSGIFQLFLITALLLLTFWRPKDWPVVVAFGMGGVAGTGWWLLVHLYPEPAVAIEQYRFLSGAVFDVGGAEVRSQVLRVIRHYLWYGFWRYTRLGALESIYAAIGLVGLLWRRTPADRFWLLATGLYIVGYVTIVPFLGLYHLVQWMPFLTVAMAATLAGLAGVIVRWIEAQPGLPGLVRQWPRPVWTAALAAPLLGAYIAGTAFLSFRSLPIDYFRYASDLNALIPTGASVFGESSWYFEINDGPFTDDIYLAFSRRAGPEQTYDDILTVMAEVAVERQVEIMLVDEYFSYIYGFNDVSLRYHQAIVDYAETYCTQTGEVAGLSYGVEQGGPINRTTRVFTCDWRNSPAR